MLDLKKAPSRAVITEVGPRDGFQAEERTVPLDLKAEAVIRLAKAGLSDIQAVSFVHPEKIPQMADPEKLLDLLPEDVRALVSGLVLNIRGLERASASGLSKVTVSVSASEAHGLKNAGLDFESAKKEAERMAILAKQEGIFTRADIQCAFGCVYEGEVPAERVMELVEIFAFHEPGVISFSDTTGMGSPVSVSSLLDRAAPIAGDIPLALHLHDTRGLGLVNLYAALSKGVCRFDTSFAGMGGCPFVQGAAGNIATEDTVHLLHTLGISAGIDIKGVAECSRMMAAFFNKNFSGGLYNLV